MKPNLILIFIFSMFTVYGSLLTAKAQQRGFQEVNITLNGSSQALYKQSHALVIGISDYTAGWPDLPGVKNDIAAVKTALEKHDFDVTLLENATKEQMDKSISAFISKYGQEADNRLLFYFAGHGHTIKTSYGDELGYIVPVDAPNPVSDAAGFQNMAMEMAQIEIYAKRIQSKHAMFLFDACFAGSLFDMRSAVSEAISYKTINPVRQFITSGSSDEQVPDKSIFREQFVLALTTPDADYDKDGFLTGSELGYFLQNKVINYSYNSQHPQYGKIRNKNLDKGDFVFTLNARPPTQPAITQVQEEVVNDDNLAKQQQAFKLIQEEQQRKAMEEEKLKKTEMDKFLSEVSGNMVLVQGGTFTMGCTPDQYPNCYGSEKPSHEVSVSSFYIGKYEITRRQWKAIMGYDADKNYSCDNCPVENVSWVDAQEFISKLNSISGMSFRLPTEAEWEFAARGGGQGKSYKYPGGNSYAKVGWFMENSDYLIRPVGQKLPNELGLYDMGGNVWEWCSDWYGDFDKDSKVNPVGADYGSGRVVKGGCYLIGSIRGRTASRGTSLQTVKEPGTGFRLAKNK